MADQCPNLKSALKAIIRDVVNQKSIEDVDDEADAHQVYSDPVSRS